MAKNVGDTLRDSVNQVVQQAARSVTSDERRRSARRSGMRGVALGAGLVALPLAAKAASGPIMPRVAVGAA